MDYGHPMKASKISEKLGRCVHTSIWDSLIFLFKWQNLTYQKTLQTVCLDWIWTRPKFFVKSFIEFFVKFSIKLVIKFFFQLQNLTYPKTLQTGCRNWIWISPEKYGNDGICLVQLVSHLQSAISWSIKRFKSSSRFQDLTEIR